MPGEMDQVERAVAVLGRQSTVGIAPRRAPVGVVVAGHVLQPLQAVDVVDHGAGHGDVDLSSGHRPVAQFVRHLLRPVLVCAGFRVVAVIGHQIVVRHDRAAERGRQVIAVARGRIVLQRDDVAVVGVADRRADRGGVVGLAHVHGIERPEIRHVVVIHVRRRDRRGCAGNRGATDHHADRDRDRRFAHRHRCLSLELRTWLMDR